jgi:sensor histidine kinase YesM
MVETNFNNFNENIFSKIPEKVIENILIELLCNALKKARNKSHKKLTVEIDSQKIVATVIAGAKIEIDKNKFLKHLSAKDPIPKYGIGLFTINKIVQKYTDKSITVNIDIEKNIFETIIPLN